MTLKTRNSHKPPVFSDFWTGCRQIIMFFRLFANVFRNSQETCSTKNKKKYIVVEPRSTRDIEILFKVIVKVPVVGNTFFCNF